MSRDSLKDTKDEEDKQLYKGAFDDFDWNKSGTIPNSVSLIREEVLSYRIIVKCLL